MSALKFYEVDKKYISFLKKHENKIPNIDYDKHDKFICGILFEINGFKYYAPISSFSKRQKTNFLIKNNEGRVTSSIRFSFMFPVPDNAVRIKDFSKEEQQYKRLLMEEYRYCNKNAEKIIDKAKHIYDSVIQGEDLIMKKNCCDFKKLESVYSQYINKEA